MLNYSLYIFFAFISFNTLISQEYKWIPIDSVAEKYNGTKIAYKFVDLQCSDSINCITIGNLNTRYPWNRVSHDGGRTWVTTLKDTAIFYVDSIGNKYTVYKPPKAMCLSYPDTSLCIIACDSGYIWRSTDNCETWSKYKLPTEWELLDLQMFNNKFGAAISYYQLFLTFDGGENWDSVRVIIPDSLFPEVFLDVMIPEDSIIIMIAYKKEFKDYILYSQDNGKSWEVFHNLPCRVSRLHFFNRNRGIAVGGNVIINGHYRPRDAVLVTDDGCKNWKVVLDSHFSESASLWKTSFYNNLKGVALNYNWCFWRTNDGGNTWFFDDSPEYPTVNDIFVDMEYFKENSLMAITEQTGYTYLYTNDYDNVPFSEEEISSNLYPNPSSEKCYLKLISNINPDNSKIEIFNNLGEKIITDIFKKSDNGNEITYEINTSNLASELYYPRFFIRKIMYKIQAMKNAWNYPKDLKTIVAALEPDIISKFSSSHFSLYKNRC